MPTELTLLLGEAGSGKTERLLAEYRAALAAARERGRPGTVLWLAPTHRTQQSIVERLLDSGAPVQIAPGVLTFDVFAERILAAAGRPATPMSPVMKRLLLRRIVADLGGRGQLAHFASVMRTSGFLDVVSALITELKREEIWPDEFLEACARRPPRRARRDRELGLIYDRYQHHLARQNWYDNEGRFWLARTALAEGVRGPLVNTEFLVVDGFADFTQTQYEILGHLMQWIPRGIISLPFEDPLTRPELFGKPRATIDRIRRHLLPGTSCRTEHLVADRSEWPPGLRTVASSMFASPASIVRGTDAGGLEVIAATGPLGETRAVARRIKRLLLGGTPPSAIVVAVRSVADQGPAWKDYFDQSGIPAWSESGSPLISRPIIKALFAVLQLEIDNWPFARLTQLLGSNYFRPGWPELSTGCRSVSRMLRRLKLDAGKDLMLRVLGRVAGGLAFDDDSSSTSGREGRANLAADARSAEAILKRLAAVTERLRGKRPLADWSDVIASLGRDLGWQFPPRTENAADLDAGDRDDWDLVQRIVRTAGDADRRLILSADAKAARLRKMDLAEFVEELRDLLRGERIKPGGDPGGCVRILDVEQARHLDVPHLFAAGLSESSFPLNRSDDCLFGELERQEYAMSGLPLQHREQHHRDEMFLFYSLLTRARTRLTLSFAAVNSSGQPVFASPYVTALRSLFSDSAFPEVHEGQLDPVPEVELAMTESDLRLLAVQEGRSGRPGLFGRLGERADWRPTGLNLLASIDVNSHRFHERGFTGYEGRQSCEPNLASLRQRFGSRHQFSATEMEAYAICPYRFWVNSVLGIDDLPSPEQATDYASRGSLVHDVLAQLLREGLDKPAEQLAARFQALVEDRLAAQIPETRLQQALVRIELRLLAQWGQAFARQQSDYARQLAETWSGIESLPPEIPFGKLPGALPHDVAADPLAFGSGDDMVQVRGRIDRVDTGFHSGRRVFNVIDYKTGSPPRANMTDLKTGRSIQLALYTLAVWRLGLAGPDADPFQFGYWSLKASGFKRGYQRHSQTMAPLQDGLMDTLQLALDDLIPRVADGIRTGMFLVENSDPNCTGHCPLRTTCRVNQIRPLARKLNKIGDILPTGGADSDTD